MHEAIDTDAAPKKYRRLVHMIWLVPFLVIGGITYVVSNSENNGQIVNNAAEQLALDVPNTTTETIETPYYSLEYSSEFKLQKDPVRSPELLDLQVLLSHSEKNSPGSIRASLGIEKLPDGGVKEMSPYKLAEAYPDKYAIDQKTFNGVVSYVLTKYDDGSVKIVLLPHNNVVLIMALASQTIGDKPKYDVFIDQATDSLIWK